MFWIYPHETWMNIVFLSLVRFHISYFARAFSYSERFVGQAPDAYSSLILDVVRGDHSRCDAGLWKLALLMIL